MIYRRTVRNQVYRRIAEHTWNPADLLQRGQPCRVHSMHHLPDERRMRQKVIRRTPRHRRYSTAPCLNPPDTPQGAHADEASNIAILKLVSRSHAAPGCSKGNQYAYDNPLRHGLDAPNNGVATVSIHGDGISTHSSHHHGVAVTHSGG